MQENSTLMQFFLNLKIYSIAWSLRRLHIPVNKDALVLEVGSGGNPYFRSNILIDAYLDTRERHYEKLITDRPTVLGFVENLPFKDDCFDFVIASHVLEHSKDPEIFLSELQRVAKAGYIEVPDAFFERLNCYFDHRLEITDINNELIIKKKKSYIEDNEIYELFTNKVSGIFNKLVTKYPFHFNVRYYWSKEDGGIKYTILNPDYKFNWEPPHSERVEANLSFVSHIKQLLLTFIRKFLSQNSRNSQINITDFIRCPNCHHNEFTQNKNEIICKKCNSEYEILENNIIKFN